MSKNDSLDEYARRRPNPTEDMSDAGRDVDHRRTPGAFGHEPEHLDMASTVDRRLRGPLDSTQNPGGVHRAGIDARAGDPQLHRQTDVVAAQMNDGASARAPSESRRDAPTATRKQSSSAPRSRRLISSAFERVRRSRRFQLVVDRLLDLNHQVTRGLLELQDEEPRR